jgi:hypothetical protein
MDLQIQELKNSIIEEVKNSIIEEVNLKNNIIEKEMNQMKDKIELLKNENSILKNNIIIINAFICLLLLTK